MKRECSTTTDAADAGEVSREASSHTKAARIWSAGQGTENNATVAASAQATRAGVDSKQYQLRIVVHRGLLEQLHCGLNRMRICEDVKWI